MASILSRNQTHATPVLAIGTADMCSGWGHVRPLDWLPTKKPSVFYQKKLSHGSIESQGAPGFTAHPPKPVDRRNQFRPPSSAQHEAQHSCHCVGLRCGGRSSRRCAAPCMHASMDGVSLNSKGRFRNKPLSLLHCLLNSKPYHCYRHRGVPHAADVPGQQWHVGLA